MGDAGFPTTKTLPMMPMSLGLEATYIPSIACLRMYSGCPFVSESGGAEAKAAPEREDLGDFPPRPWYVHRVRVVWSGRERACARAIVCSYVRVFVSE